MSEKGTVEDGVIIINNGEIEDIGTYKELKNKLDNISMYDYGEKVITPSLIDCHCHLLEYAPGSLYPVTKETYLEAGRILLFNALLSGITCIGEQICGSPICNISIDDYMQIAKDSPIRVKFSLNTITRGDAATKLGISHGLFRFWFNGGVISIGTYNKIQGNFKKYNLI